MLAVGKSALAWPSCFSTVQGEAVSRPVHRLPPSRRLVAHGASGANDEGPGGNGDQPAAVPQKFLWTCM